MLRLAMEKGPETRVWTHLGPVDDMVLKDNPT